MLRYSGDGLGLPDRAALDANLSTTLPRFAWATDRLGVATSGAGLAYDGLRRAVGEYFERRHFYFEVRGNSTGPLSAIEDDSLRNSLIKALFQTASTEVRGEITSHAFFLSTVVKLPFFETVNAPTILFSVTGESLGKDRDFFVCRDTSGCAAHFDLPRAINGALREFTERQYLLRYWLTARGALDISAVVRGRLSRSASELVKNLSRSGDLHFLEISRNEINGAVVLVVYKGSKDERVRYCVGLSCDTTPVAAADRAIKELWQSYIFLCNMAKESDAKSLVHDRYHTYFLECNTLATADAMLSTIEPLTGLTPTTMSSNLIESIQTRFQHLLCYIRQINVLSKRLWCVRVISPEAFFHIDNSLFFNLNCAYSEPFSSEIIPSRLHSMVPFP